MSIKTTAKRLLVVCATILMVAVAMPTAAQASSTQITGRSTVAQTVYTGPSASYVTAGSIGLNEQVFVLGKEKGVAWYHIQYYAGSQQKSGYVPTSTITSISGGSPAEEVFYGGYAYSNAAQTVWSVDVSSIAVNIGSIGAGEGVTRLYAYGNVMYIEYTTPSGPKRGYVYNPNFSYPVSPTVVARVTQNSTITYGVHPGVTWSTAGSVNAGEDVAVLAASDSKKLAYVEYNTNSGRKRGYMSTNNLALHGGLTSYVTLPDIYELPGGITFILQACTISSNATVYAGPSTVYVQVGSVVSGQAIMSCPGSTTVNGVTWKYIIYHDSRDALGYQRSGFIH